MYKDSKWPIVSLTKRRKFDYFEYRVQDHSQDITLTDEPLNTSFYLYNPYTGETILTTDYEKIDRSQSLWAPSELPLEDDEFNDKSQDTDPDIMYSTLRTSIVSATGDVQSIILVSQNYLSKKNQVFKAVTKYSIQDIEIAASKITCVIRGYLTKISLRRYFRSRFHRVLDNDSGYYYFQDNLHLTKEASWFKPRLAYPDDIEVLQGNFELIDNKNNQTLEGNYSEQTLMNGPYYQLTRIGKVNKDRAIHHAFLVDPIRHELAYKNHEDIPLDNIEIGSLISWIEGYKLKSIEMSEYAILRAAESHRNWNLIIDIIEQQDDNEWILLYSLFSLSKLEIPLDNENNLSKAGEFVADLCIKILESDKLFYNETLKVFSLYCLYNIVACPEGRVYYFNADSIVDFGETRNIALERFIVRRIQVFNKFLTNIPQESFEVIDDSVLTSLAKPTQRGVELVEGSLRCLSSLAHKAEYREQMSFLTTNSCMKGILTCLEFSSVVINGLNYFYNLCYRCEGSHEILNRKNTRSLLVPIREMHGGDSEVLYSCRRFELSLMKEGWRGQIEELLHRELNGEELDDEYLQIMSLESDSISFSDSLDMINRPNSSKASSRNSRRDSMSSDYSSHISTYSSVMSQSNFSFDNTSVSPSGNISRSNSIRSKK